MNRYGSHAAQVSKTMKEKRYKDESLEKEMTASIGKWLAIVIIAFILAFLILAFASPQILTTFVDYTKNILYIVVGGGVVVYIVIKVFVGKK